MPHCLVVSASGIGGFGICGRMTARHVGNLILVGDMQTECTRQTPPLAPGVAMAAAMQADAVLNHYHAHWEKRGRE